MSSARAPWLASEEHHEPFSGASVIGKPLSHRGRNTIVLVAIVCLLVLGAIYAVGIWKGGGDDEPTTKPPALGIDSPSPSPSKSPKPEPSSTGLPAWQKNLVRVEAVNGDCWMEVRREGPQGVVLFSGTVDDGDKQKFKGEVLWLSLGNPAAVRLEVQGKDVKVKGDVGPWPVLIDRGRVTQGSDTEG